MDILKLIHNDKLVVLNAQQQAQIKGGTDTTTDADTTIVIVDVDSM